jgi:hypothetical protein
MFKKPQKPVRHYEAGDFVVGSIGSENDPVGRGDINYGGSGDFLGEGVRSGIDSWDKAYTDAGGKLASKFGLSDLKQFATDNKAFLTGAGALAGVYGGGASAENKTGYQGVIPTLAASRSMIAAPPTRAQGYRPGAGGIDYGGDVSYKLAPGMDPYANLSGTSGSAAGANLTSDANSVAATTAAAAKTAADLAAAKKAGDAAAIAAAQKAADAAAAAKAAADKAAADKAAADKAAASKTTNLGSAGYQAAIKSGLTPAQYYGNINQWLIDNPRASRTEIDAIMAKIGVSKEDLQKALGTSTFSDFTKYGLTQGQGLQELNFKISDWVEKNPFATSQEIKDIMKASGASQEDVARGINALSASAGKEAAIVGGMGLDQLYKNILDYQSKPRTPEEIAAALAATGLEQRDLNAAQKYAKEKGYVGNPKSEAATFDYLANTKAADTSTKNTSVADTSAVDTSLADTLAAVNLNAGTSAVDVPTSNAVADVVSGVSNTAPITSAPASYYDEGAGMEMLYPTAVANDVSSDVSSTPAAIADVVQAASTPTAVQDTTPDNSGKLSEIYQYFAMPETQAALASGDTRSIAETMQALGYSPAEVAAATGSNPAEVQAAYDAALGIGKEDTRYMQYAGGGEIAMAKGRYLQGETDGMADKLPARIGRDQPAALSHGEFVIPADVVSHMGNGNSDAGAKKLYQMMDKIRMARTGNKKQGKKINPDKFMPGGLAQAYAAGGEVKRFQEGGATTANKNSSLGISGIESNLSNWAGPYVTNMLGQGQALANMPYQAYMGQLTAGESPLQTQGFNAAADMTVPTSLTTAAQTAGDVASTAKNLPAYSSGTFGNQFTAPTASQATNFTNQYTAPGAYSPTTSSFDATQAQAYMNPYLEQSLKPQLEEARRQSLLTQQQNAAKMTGAGAFGGSRQALMDTETQRNLGTNLANITGQGYNTAYGNAMNQFNADQQRKMQEAQFGAQQGMSAAQLQAQYGLSAQQANEAARQFGAQQGMTAAQLGAQYGLAGQQAGEQSRQFGANYGLQGLQTGLQAAQAQGALGTQINQAGLGNLNAMLTAGAQQRGIESEGIAADKAQFEEARANPYKMVQYQQSLLQGLPLAAQSYQGIAPSDLTKAAQGATTVNQLLKNLGLA